MLSGDVLSRWLQRRAGSVVSGSLVRLSPSGLLRVSTVTDSRRLRVELPVAHGGQAAVARAVLDGHDGPSLALRVQAVSSEQEKARQMERLVAMLTVAEAARNDPDAYPAVLPVHESFVVAVPGTEIGSTGPTTEHELWCDVMAWCPRNLANYHAETGPSDRDPRTVAAQILPVLATVRAVHDNLNIVHRDITPNNVMVDEAGRLLLADWGIAHAVAADRTSTHTQMVGNRGFSLPPEMLAGDTAVGRYTDAWYLGSLLVWMLTGQPPDPRGQLPPGLPGGSDGERLATVARGLCRPDPHQRMDLSEAVEHLSGLVVPGWAVAAPVVAPVQPNAPAWGTPHTSQYDARPAVPGPPSGTTRVTDATSWSTEVPGQARSSSGKVLGAVIASAAVLVVGLVAGALWLISQGGRDTPTASTSSQGRPSKTADTSLAAAEPSSEPEPEPSDSDPPSDEPAYPPFTGLSAAQSAFPLLDNPTCTQADPATYVPAGAKEVYRCNWSGINATVYLTLWESAAQGAAAWEKLDLGGVMTMSSGTWHMTADPTVPRGPSFEISTSAARPSLATACYSDLPYCSTVEFGDSFEYDKANSRMSVLTPAEAAALVASWPS